MDDGFPTLPKQPVAFNLFSNRGYLNALDLPELSNMPFLSLHPQLKEKLTPIAKSTFLLVCGDIPIGTCVLISHRLLIIAKHCLDYLSPNSELFVVSDFLNYSSCFYFKVAQVIRHPSEDVALLVVLGNPSLQHKIFVQCSFVEQPAGGYYMVHHAGGRPMQVSSGKIPDFNGRLYSLTHFLLADAGPIASGAGIYDANSLKLIGINTQRTIELGQISRKISLLNSIKDWIQLNIQQHAVEGALVKKFEPIKMDTPPAPLVLDTSHQELYRDDLETLTWLRAQRRAVEIINFLDRLNQYLRNEIPITAITLPESIENYRRIFDSHQPQHFGTRSAKTRINPNIGSNIQNPLCIYLAIALDNIFSLFYSRIPINERNSFLIDRSTNNEWAIELEPIPLGYPESGGVATIARLDGHILGKFHFYPIDRNDVDIVRHKVNVIDARRVLAFVIDHRPVRLPSYYRDSNRHSC